jgi:hypothetical protein
MELEMHAIVTECAGVASGKAPLERAASRATFEVCRGVKC